MKYRLTIFCLSHSSYGTAELCAHHVVVIAHLVRTSDICNLAPVLILVLLANFLNDQRQEFNFFPNPNGDYFNSSNWVTN